MRLYVINKISNRKTYLNLSATTRGELKYLIGHPYFTLNNDSRYTYSVNEVYAEQGTPYSIAGAVIGGILGLVLGPEGAIVGAALGGGIGYSSDTTEAKRVANFNNSSV